MAICPECDTEFDPVSRVIITNPHVKQVPRHVAAETCHVVERLRGLAERIEAGEFSGDASTPDGAVLLLFDSTQRRLTVAPLGVNIGAQGQVDVLAAFFSGVKARAVSEGVRR